MVSVLVALTLAVSPAGGLVLPDRFELSPPVLLAQANPAPAAPAPASEAAAAAPVVEAATPAPAMDFDLLGDAPKPAAPTVDLEALKTRRTMLKVHQGVGIGLMVLELATVVLGQINYRDLYGGGDRTGQFKLTHQVLSYSAMGVFLTNEMLALLAPSPLAKTSQGFDRTMLHRISMFTGAAGMVANLILGIVTSYTLPGRDMQRDVAKAHLFIGYGTYAAMAVGASAMIF